MLGLVVLVIMVFIGFFDVCRFGLALISSPPILVSSPKKQIQFWHVLCLTYDSWRNVWKWHHRIIQSTSLLYILRVVPAWTMAIIGGSCLPVIPEVVPTVSVDYILPRKLPCPLKNDVWKNMFLLKWYLFRWQVKFSGRYLLFFFAFCVGPSLDQHGHGNSHGCQVTFRSA